MNKDEYQCALCKGIFKKDKSDEEAMAEYRRLYKDPIFLRDEIVPVCDPCFLLIDPEGNPEEVAEAKEELYKEYKHENN